jgi:serine phosphatase RsbU (regulator of sigma subunit)
MIKTFNLFKKAQCKLQITILFFVISMSCLKSYPQDITKVNEINVQLTKAESDSLKIQLWIKLSGMYSNSNTDSSLKYAKKALELSETKNDKKLRAMSYHNIGVTYYYKGDYDIALDYMFKSLKISEEIDSKKEIGSAYNNIGNIYWMQGNLKEALDFYFKDLDISKKIGDEVNYAKTIGNIGIIYDDLGETDKALEYYNKGASLSEKLGDTDSYVNANINIGVVHQGLHNHKLAIEYFLKAKEISIEIKNKDALALSLINSGLSYTKLKEYEKAEKALNEAILVTKEIGSKNYLNYAYKYLSKLKYEMADYKSALENYSISVKYKDSIFNEEKSKQITEMQAFFETEQKQKQIEIQNLKLTQQSLEIDRKQVVIYGITAGFILMILLALISYRSYRQKKKSNEIILLQNKSLEQANEEISAQRDEIEAQRDMVVAQKNHIEQQKKEITDSIDYAMYIQQAVLPSGKYADEIFGNHFILFKPKHVVSGDFYWGAIINDWLIATVADCTGHGVPGAFMSMLGVSFLNEIVRKKEIFQASQVLDELRKSLIDSLQQKGNIDEQKDGMDMVLCAINLKTKSLQFSGANNSLYIVDNKKQLNEIMSDKQPVGIHDKMLPFTNHELQLNKGDTLYLKSDGFEDQFGGDKGRKFLSKNLKQLIIDHSQLPMQEQKEILEKTILDWIGNGDQIDDITILGIRM